MEILRTCAEFQARALKWRAKGLRTALVPSMGYFHAGHVSLMRFARENADKVCLSLFVNPTQFGPNEDLSSYPRDFKRDSRLAEETGVDVLFAPEPTEVYPPGYATWVNVEGLGGNLCGRSRPGHFKGVSTVVAKLLLLAQPSFAVFGEKDWQQLAIIKRMVADLNIPVEIIGRPIVREPDGLALSSRNVYLSPEERIQAPELYKGLLYAKELFAKPGLAPAELTSALKLRYAEKAPLGQPDYIELVDPYSIEILGDLKGPALLAVAVRFGRARLIDNLLLRA